MSLRYLLNAFNAFIAFFTRSSTPAVAPATPAAPATPIDIPPRTQLVWDWGIGFHPNFVYGTPRLQDWSSPLDPYSASTDSTYELEVFELEL